MQLSGVDLDAKLVLLEFLLTSTDLQGSTRRAIDWLIAHSDVQQALVAVAEPGTGQLLLVAEHGVSSAAIADFAITLDETSHAPVRAWGRSEPTYFEGPGVSFRSPIEGTPFHAIPLRADD